jgi:hypothetical protein
MRGISGLAENRLTSEEELCSVEYVGMLQRDTSCHPRQYITTLLLLLKWRRSGVQLSLQLPVDNENHEVG